MRGLVLYAKLLHWNAETCIFHVLYAVLVLYGHVLNIYRIAAPSVRVCWLVPRLVTTFYGRSIVAEHEYVRQSWMFPGVSPDVTTKPTCYDLTNILVRYL